MLYPIAIPFTSLDIEMLEVHGKITDLLATLKEKNVDTTLIDGLWSICKIELIQNNLPRRNGLLIFKEKPELATIDYHFHKWEELAKKEEDPEDIFMDTFWLLENFLRRLYAALDDDMVAREVFSDDVAKSLARAKEEHTEQCLEEIELIESVPIDQDDYTEPMIIGKIVLGKITEEPYAFLLEVRLSDNDLTALGSVLARIIPFDTGFDMDHGPIIFDLPDNIIELMKDDYMGIRTLLHTHYFQKNFLIHLSELLTEVNGEFIIGIGLGPEVNNNSGFPYFSFEKIRSEDSQLFTIQQIEEEGDGLNC